MVGRTIAILAVLTVCVACAPDILSTTPVETQQVHYAISHPAWNPRSVTSIGGSLISVAVISGRDGPTISVISVFEGSVTLHGEFSWAVVSPAKRVFYSTPIAPWSSDSVLVFAHDDQRSATLLEFSLGKSPGIVWHGSCGMNAEMVFDSGRDSLVVVDDRTLTTIGSDWKAEESELDVAISQPVPFGDGIIAKAGDGLAFLSAGVLQSGSSTSRRNRVRQVAAAGARVVVLTAHWIGDQECLEVLSSGPGSQRCQYGRLPEAVWRVRSFRDSAVLWDVDRGHVLLVDCSGLRDLQWDSSVLEGMVWATAGDDGLVLSDDSGYLVLTVG